jgi:hypothetical protein
VPGAESGVSGGVLAGPLPSGIGVGGEFGFGQEVFQKAAKRLRDEDPRFANLGDDDLQAIAWFLEKETWGKKGYTTKAGEGGSMELEANFAGVSDREALKETRKQAETDPTFTERNKLEKELADKKTIKARETANDFYEENKWILDMTPAGRRNSFMESQGLDKDAATKAAADLLGKAVLSLSECRPGVPHTYFKHLLEGKSLPISYHNYPSRGALAACLRST